MSTRINDRLAQVHKVGLSSRYFSVHEGGTVLLDDRLWRVFLAATRERRTLVLDNPFVQDICKAFVARGQPDHLLTEIDAAMRLGMKVEEAVARFLLVEARDVRP